MNVDCWNAIKTEYITGEISYRKLAEKWGVPFRTLSYRASEEGWKKERDKYRDTVATRSLQIVATKASSENANRLLKLQEAADNMGKVIAEIFDDSKQFNRYIVATSDGPEEREYRKYDTKAIKDLTGAMKDLASVLRNIYDIPTAQEKAAMDIAAERLALDRRKNDMFDDDESETGVIELTPVQEDDDE